MDFSIASFSALLLVFSVLAFQCSADGDKTATLTVDVGSNGRSIAANFFGVFFEVNIMFHSYTWIRISCCWGAN